MKECYLCFNCLLMSYSELCGVDWVLNFFARSTFGVLDTEILWKIDGCRFFISMLSAIVSACFSLFSLIEHY